MTTLTHRDLEKFWIRCYLNPSTDLIESAIDRAYLDLSRTLHGIAQKQTKDKQDLLKSKVKKNILEILSTTFNNQKDFDIWHEQKCEELIAAYKNIFDHKLFIGQAQKWINMSLKYLFALGEDQINGISNNYGYFHFPVDNIIQDKLLKSGIPKFKISWSRIDNYIEYLNYQVLVRTKFSEQIPLDVEFKLFNNENIS